LLGGGVVAAVGGCELTEFAVVVDAAGELGRGAGVLVDDWVVVIVGSCELTGFSDVVGAADRVGGGIRFLVAGGVGPVVSSSGSRKAVVDVCADTPAGIDTFVGSIKDFVVAGDKGGGDCLDVGTAASPDCSVQYTEGVAPAVGNCGASGTTFVCLSELCVNAIDCSIADFDGDNMMSGGDCREAGTRALPDQSVQWTAG
jgi:hypothetical protein